MRIVNSLDWDLWKNFIDELPSANVFHTPEMHEVFSRTKGHLPEIWATLDDNGKILALFLPVEVRLFNGLAKFFSSRAISYGSVLAEAGEAGKEALSMLLQKYTRDVSFANLFTELRNHTDQNEIQDVLQKNGYMFEGHLNYLLNIQRDPQEILESFKRDAYRRIRKNMIKGVLEVTEITDRSDISTFYNLLRKTYQYARIPLADITLFESAFDVLYPKKMIRFTLIYLGDVPVTASVSLLYKNVIYGWYNGTDRAYSTFGPNEYEVWELINWGIDKGYHVFDFGGAGKPDFPYGVRDFKAKFNGQLVNYGRNICIHAPFRFNLSKISYQTARKSSQLLNEIID